MTSLLSTDAVSADKVAPLYLRVDKNGFPLQKQVPLTRQVVTATGAVPSPCPDIVVISGAAPITLTAASLTNLYGRDVTFCSDGTNAVQHIVVLPNNVINGATDTITFAANAFASITLRFLQSNTLANSFVCVMGSNQVVLS